MVQEAREVCDLGCLVKKKQASMQPCLSNGICSTGLTGASRSTPSDRLGDSHLVVSENRGP